MATVKMAVGALIALGAMALGGSSALAATGDTVACKTASAPCAASSQYSSGTPFGATLKPASGGAVLKTNIDTFTCESSAGSVKNTTQAGTPLPGQLTALTIGECGDSNGQSCAVTVSGLPYSASSFSGSVAGNGTFRLNSASVKFVCGSFFNCTFTAPSGGINAVFTGGNPADIRFNGVPLSNAGGLLCPSSATFTAEYLTNGANQGVWLEKSS